MFYQQAPPDRRRLGSGPPHALPDRPAGDLFARDRQRLNKNRKNPVIGQLNSKINSLGSLFGAQLAGVRLGRASAAGSCGPRGSMSRRVATKRLFRAKRHTENTLIIN